MVFLELQRYFRVSPVIQPPFVLAQGSAIFHSRCEGEQGVVLKSLQGKIDLI